MDNNTRVEMLEWLLSNAVGWLRVMHKNQTHPSLALGELIRLIEVQVPNAKAAP